MNYFDKVAITLDPVARFLSTYRHFALEQDKHLRCQVDFFKQSDVDSVVPLKKLDQYFIQRGWKDLPHENKSRTSFDLGDSQTERLRWIYELTNCLTEDD